MHRLQRFLLTDQKAVEQVFATFLTQDHAKVMLAHDTDHSHSISISELEKVRALPPPPSHPLRSEFLPR